ncbi:MAG: hypothetical protein FRX48_09050 [Lasallia pustulata]|uniref:Uncharacterized protein n=1 Tax=Lasallia pustulata TaxID=136370 RepID=A0A5M8PE86_9LECA|nr:MAG: hypothetical protein FRX48_09050 [Lasallia pustulata]
MCHGYVRKHDECGHIKDFIAILKCEAGSENEPCADKVVLFKLVYKFPGLCRACYIQQEEVIFSLYEEDIADLRRALGDTRSSLRRVEELEDAVRKRLEAELVNLQLRLDECIAGREAMLVKFRLWQGVWGDG